MQCRRGCHSCCRPDLTIWNVECRAIAEYLDQNPQIVPRLIRLENEDPFGGQRCRFLEADGKCGIYEARPLICRSHGAPIQFRVQKTMERDVCPLNFEGQDLSGLPEGDVLNIETLNTLLSVINRQFDESRADERFQLRISEMD
jgi:Fe-S-cluster containining protein